MFTVKHVFAGTDHFYTASGVRALGFDKAYNDVYFKEIGNPQRVVLDDVDDGGTLRELHFGTVYVMNEQGATVGKYNMATGEPYTPPAPPPYDPEDRTTRVTFTDSAADTMERRKLRDN